LDTTSRISKEMEIPQPDGPDVNIGRSMVALLWSFTTISAGILALRVFTRIHFTRRRLKFDDYTIIMAWVSYSFQGTEHTILTLD
jgi:hypothetical protein